MLEFLVSEPPDEFTVVVTGGDAVFIAVGEDKIERFNDNEIIYRPGRMP